MLPNSSGFVRYDFQMNMRLICQTVMAVKLPLSEDETFEWCCTLIPEKGFKKVTSHLHFMKVGVASGLHLQKRSLLAEFFGD